MWMAITFLGCVAAVWLFYLAEQILDQRHEYRMARLKQGDKG